MKKIILFDIDGTLFDVSKFLSLFYANLSSHFQLNNLDIENLQKLYDDTKKEAGYFIPSLFINKINSNFPQINKDTLEKLFWSADLFEKSMHKDVSVIKDLSNLATIGIFSKGDNKFQKYKLKFINCSINDKNIYIYPNKIDKINETLSYYTNCIIYLVDDRLDVLTKVKEINSDVKIILIDRNGRFSHNKDISRIKNLNEIKSIL